MLHECENRCDAVCYKRTCHLPAVRLSPPGSCRTSHVPGCSTHARLVKDPVISYFKLYRDVKCSSLMEDLLLRLVF